VPEFVRERRGLREDRPVATEFDHQEAHVGRRRVHFEEGSSTIQRQRRQGSNPHVDDDRRRLEAIEHGAERRRFLGRVGNQRLQRRSGSTHVRQRREVPIGHGLTLGWCAEREQAHPCLPDESHLTHVYRD